MTASVHRRPVTFLVVDDDLDGTYLTERSLRKTFPDCIVTSCTSADEAMLRLATIKPDAIVTDHQLGRQSGGEFISHVREEGLTCPVVMVTCSDNPDVVEAAMRAGATKVFRAGGDEFAKFLHGEISRQPS
jgi:CheY-like chemotaxis protein